MIELVGEVSVINRAYPVELLLKYLLSNFRHNFIAKSDACVKNDI